MTQDQFQIIRELVGKEIHSLNSQIEQINRRFENGRSVNKDNQWLLGDKKRQLGTRAHELQQALNALDARLKDESLN